MAIYDFLNNSSMGSFTGSVNKLGASIFGASSQPTSTTNAPKSTYTIIPTGTSGGSSSNNIKYSTVIPKGGEPVYSGGYSPDKQIGTYDKSGNIIPNYTPAQAESILNSATQSLGYGGYSDFARSQTGTKSGTTGGGAPTSSTLSNMQQQLAQMTEYLTQAQQQVTIPVTKKYKANIPEAPRGITIADFQNDARQALQSSIDAINASYVSLLNKQEEEEERLSGQQRAMAARGGELQSSTYGAREQQMQTKFTEQRQALEAQKQQQLGQIELQVQQIAQNWAKIELAQQQQNYTMARLAYADNLAMATDMMTSLGSMGAGFNDLSPEIQQQLIQTTGMPPEYIQGKMKLAHYNSIKDTAKTQVNVDGSLQYTYIDPATGQVATETIDAKIPVGSKIQSITDGGSIIYEKGGAFYIDNSFSNEIVSGNLATYAQKQMISGSASQSSSKEATAQDIRFTNTAVQYMAGEIDYNSASADEKAIIDMLRSPEVDIRPVDWNNMDVTGSAQDAAQFESFLDSLSSGVFLNPVSGQYVEFTDTQLKKIALNLESNISGNAKKIYNKSAFSKIYGTNK